MKNILILFGSPHNDGACGKMMDHFVGLFNNREDVIIQKYFAYDMVFNHCTDCRICHTSTTCAFDDLEKYYHDLENCDIFLIITPIHNLSFSSPVKSLLDRHQKYWASYNILKNVPAIHQQKKAYLFTSAGSKRLSDSLMLEKQLIPHLIPLNAEFVRSFNYVDADNFSDLSGIFKQVNNEFYPFSTF